MVVTHPRPTLGVGSDRKHSIQYSGAIGRRCQLLEGGKKMKPMLEVYLLHKLQHVFTGRRSIVTHFPQLDRIDYLVKSYNY